MSIEIEFPDRRADVLAALEVLAATRPHLAEDQLDPRWPDLTNAVHWLVDDTFWDYRDPAESIGQLLRSDAEASAVKSVVSAVVMVSSDRVPTRRTPPGSAILAGVTSWSGLVERSMR